MSNDFTETTEAAMNRIIKEKGCDTNKISDGYHTFGELYEHRITIFIALCKALHFDENQIEDDGSSVVWKSKKHSDGELAFGGTWFVLGINKDAGRQITYHLPIDKWGDCSFATELETAPEWDGHTSEDVLNRLMAL